LDELSNVSEIRPTAVGGSFTSNLHGTQSKSFAKSDQRQLVDGSSQPTGKQRTFLESNELRSEKGWLCTIHHLPLAEFRSASYGFATFD
jgi:hypothetical protein